MVGATINGVATVQPSAHAEGWSLISKTLKIFGKFCLVYEKASLVIAMPLREVSVF